MALQFSALTDTCLKLMYNVIIIIIVYFEKVHFFQAQLGLEVCPDMRSLHISLNSVHSGCKLSTFMASFTHSLQVFLLFPTLLPYYLRPLWTHLRHSTHMIELWPTPFFQTPHGCSPESSISSRRCISPSTPWFDAECSASKRKSRMLERHYRRMKSVLDRLEWLSQQRRTHALYQSKQNSYWEAKISESRGNLKKLWKNLASVSKREKVVSHPSKGLTAESFLNAFRDKVEGVRASTALAPPPSFDSPPCTSSFSRFRMIGESDVHRLISAAANKQCELDPVPTMACEEVCKWIIAIHHASIQRVTNCWSVSIFTEMRRGDVDSEEAYARSEWSAQLPPHIQLDLSLRTSRASGSRAAHELHLNKQPAAGQTIGLSQTSIHRDSVLRVLSDAFAAADRGLVTLIGFLDLSAAFDTVDHRILLDRLNQSFGVEDVALGWMASYFKKRSQFVSFCGSVSSTAYVSRLVCLKAPFWDLPISSPTQRMFFESFMTPVLTWWATWMIFNYTITHWRLRLHL